MIGQAHVTEPLMTALRTGRIGHAYLFSGPRGCGKTTSARILARCLNCVEGPTDHPCGVCPSCVELSRDGGGSLDVVEIDAASHGGVDDARELRERAVFAPARDRYKIFIIDEAHMVTSGGFNALLKIVEEPPPHVKFIFATTEPEKVIGTIRSRTHHYPFRLIAPGALIDYVQQLCDSEGVQVEPGVLALVVRSGGGSVRDTLSILDQLIAGSEGSSVTLERATGLLGFTGTELIDEVVGALGAGDSAAAFGATDRVVQTGQDPRRFVEDLLERMRDLIVISATTVDGASAVFRGVPDDQLESMFAQSQVFASGQLSRIADVVSSTLDTMVGATAPRLHLELMIARALLVTGAGSPPAAMPAATSAGAPAGAPAAARQSMPSGQPAAPVSGGRPSGASPAAATQSPSGQSPVAQSPSGQGAAAQQPAAPPAASRPTDAQSHGAPSAPAAPVAPAPSANSGAATDGSAVDIIAAMKSARDFLKTDDSGTERPPMVPLGGHPAAATARERPESNTSANAHAGQLEPNTPPAQSGSGETPAQPSPNDVPPSASRSAAQAEQANREPRPGVPAAAASPVAASEAEPISFDDLLETWPDLLDELLESDREAWNAVRQVQPLAIEGDILTVGLASKSDLDVFKSSGAGPLREAIVGALGINVKYVPKPLPAGVRPAFAGHGGEEPAEPASQEPSPTAEPATTSAAEIHPEAASRSEAASHSGSVRESQPEPGPEPEPEYEIGPDPEPEYEPQLDPEPPYDAEPEAERESEPGPEPIPEAKPEVQSGPVPKAEAQNPEPQTPEPQTPEPQDPEPQNPEPQSSKSRESPGFTRYGESVVREVLGARFVEERPLPQGFER